MKVNPAGLSDYKPKGLLNGTYTVKVSKYEENEKWTSIRVLYEIIDGPEPEEYDSPLGDIISDFVRIDPAGMQEQWQIDRMVRTLGDIAMCFELEDFKEDGIDFDDLVGKEGRVAVSQKTGEYAKITKYLPA